MAQKCMFMLILFLLQNCIIGVKRIPKIAVIGGGVGGTSAAYFLHELFGSNGAYIHLYEAHEIGGRLATIKVNDEEYEIGGSIIHQRNKYMTNFLKTFDLQKRADRFSRFGLYNGENFVFTETNWDLINILKLTWKYGMSPLKLKAYVNELLLKFGRIYTHQEFGIAFDTVSELLDSMSKQFVELLRIPTKKGLKERGLSDKVIDDLVMATITCNYGQDTDVHEFVGSVSVAGASGGLWSVHGGNRLVPERLLEASKAVLYKAFVTKVQYVNKTKDFILEFVYSDVDSPRSMEQSEDAVKNNSTYDIVIIATPLTQDARKGIEFVNFPVEFDFPGTYHRTVCTIVDGKINYKKFGYDYEDDMVDEVLTTKLGLFFNSVSRVHPVNSTDSKNENRSEVWKVFSQDVLTEEQLSILFMEVRSVNVMDWKAYPEYSTAIRNDSFVIFDKLYHVNAIEWAASAMEMSVVGAKNVALLAYNNWFNLNITLPENPFRSLLDEL